MVYENLALADKPCCSVPLIRLSLGDWNADNPGWAITWENSAIASLRGGTFLRFVKIVSSRGSQALFISGHSSYEFEIVPLTGHSISPVGENWPYRTTVGCLIIFRRKHLFLEGEQITSLLSLICGLPSITTPRKSNLAIRTGECVFIIKIGPWLWAS